VPVVSEACTGVCVHERNSLVHAVGDVDALTAHLDLLDGDRERLLELREACLAEAPELTWWAAGRRLADAYAEAVHAVAVPALAAG
jgi:hypothetical protein